MVDSETRHLPNGFQLVHTFVAKSGVINKVSWSPDGRTLASASTDQRVYLWNVETFKLDTVLKGHREQLVCVAWSPDGHLLASGGYDQIIRLWKDGELHRTLEGHADAIYDIAWSPDGNRLVSASRDTNARIWNVETGEVHCILKSHSDWVRSAAWSPDGNMIVTGSSDTAVRLWDTYTGEELHNFAEHAKTVNSVAWSPDGRTIASGSNDQTIRIWDPSNRKLTSVLEGHTNYVRFVSFSPDGRLLVSKSADGTLRFWRYGSWESVAELELETSEKWFPNVAFHPHLPRLAVPAKRERTIEILEFDLETLLGADIASLSMNYMNAKVVLVGESSVGKSGLGIRMAEKEFRPTESTHGAQFWQIPVPDGVAQAAHAPDNVQAELTLWDLAGQAEYHLIHQLFLDDTDVALLLFDCSDPNEPFEGVPYWAKVLKKHLPPRARKLLISARCDVSPVTVGPREINNVLAKYELDGYQKTSAKTGEGVDELMHLILTSIPWDQLPRTSTLVLFQTIREYLLECKSADRPMVPMDKILRESHKRYTEHQPKLAEVEALVSLLQTRGLVYRLDPTPNVALVLLRPELINQYASSIIQAARNHPRGVGAIPERDVVTANLPLVNFKRLEPVDEKTVLESTVELLIRHDLCFREMGELVFPSQVNVMRPQPAVTQPRAEVTYEFSGALEAIYASLVVRLNHTRDFRRQEQWKYAAEFSRNGSRLGFSMRQIEEGTGELGIYFHSGVSEFDRVTFIRFITNHLQDKGIDIKEHIRLYCPNSACGREVTNRDAIETRVQAGKLDILCQYCDTPIIIPGSIEERYKSDKAYVKKQRELAEQAEQRTEQEVTDFKENQQQYTSDEDEMIHILHLSDIHLGTAEEARKYRTQLESDLKLELDVNRLEYLVISGDVASHSTKEEYEAAFELVNGLVSRFGLDASRVVVVPGNHDLNWDLSLEAYPFVHKSKLPDPLPEGRYIEAGDVGALVRDDDLYRRRFANFNEYFYRRVCGEPYPADYAEQAIVRLRPEDRLLFLALNSAWETDHHYQNRAGIHMDALAEALDQLLESEYQGWVKIAVWHHPVTRWQMMNDEFLQLLVQHEFQVCMHGHVHEAQEGFYKYDDHRGLSIIGAGTFGAPAPGQVPGIPLQYNLLTLDPKTRLLTVKTRRKDQPDGAWMADARWGDKNEPKPWYTIQLPTPQVQPVDKTIHIPQVEHISTEITPEPTTVVTEAIIARDARLISQPVSFADLEIRIFPRRDEGYPVEITVDSVQQLRGTLSLDILPWVASGDPVPDGQRLFEALLTDTGLRSFWDEARARTHQRRIRLWIDAGAAELHPLPWELLHDDGVMLSANANTPFARYLPSSQPWRRRKESRPLRILAAISSPDDLEERYNLPPLDVALERQALIETFSSLPSSAIQLDFLQDPVTPDRLAMALHDEYHVLHYVGHSSSNRLRQQSALFLQDQTGKVQVVTDDVLMNMLVRQITVPHLIYLSSCETGARSTLDGLAVGLGPKLISAGVPAVVAMQGLITIRAARQLSQVFYQQLTKHGAVDRAMNEARSTLVPADRLDAAVPVLFTRLRDAKLFDFGGSE